MNYIIKRFDVEKRELHVHFHPNYDDVIIPVNDEYIHDDHVVVTDEFVKYFILPHRPSDSHLQKLCEIDLKNKLHDRVEISLFVSKKTIESVPIIENALNMLRDKNKYFSYTSDIKKNNNSFLYDSRDHSTYYNAVKEGYNPSLFIALSMLNKMTLNNLQNFFDAKASIINPILTCVPLNEVDILTFFGKNKVVYVKKGEEHNYNEVLAFHKCAYTSSHHLVDAIILEFGTLQDFFDYQKLYFLTPKTKPLTVLQSFIENDDIDFEFNYQCVLSYRHYDLQGVDIHPSIRWMNDEPNKAIKVYIERLLVYCQIRETFASIRGFKMKNREDPIVIEIRLGIHPELASYIGNNVHNWCRILEFMLYHL